jgi:hypothetical protein
VKPLACATAHWGVPDPSLATGSEAERAYAFADTYRMLKQRIEIFVSLSLRSLDKPTLQKRLADIGRGVTRSAREKA